MLRTANSAQASLKASESWPKSKRRGLNPLIRSVFISQQNVPLTPEGFTQTLRHRATRAGLTHARASPGQVS